MRKKIITILICVILSGTMISAAGVSIENKTKFSINGYYKNPASICVISINDKIQSKENYDTVEVIDQQQISSSGLGCPFFSNLWLAQGFTPRLATLTKVEICLFRIGELSSPITISIRSSLNGNDLTSISVDGSIVYEYSEWITFDFPDISVTPNNMYFIVCRTSGGSILNYYCAEFDINNPYNRGEALGSFNYGSTWELIDKYYPEYPEPDACFKTYGLDETPDAPTISGPTSGTAGKSYPFTFTTTDPNGDDVSYYIKWGDWQTTDWTEFITSGTPYSTSHTWGSQGTYTIEAKAKDIYGAESGWTKLEITMPRNKIVNRSLFSNLLEQFPNMFQILQKLSR